MNLRKLRKVLALRNRFPSLHLLHRSAACTSSQQRTCNFGSSSTAPSLLKGRLLLCCCLLEDVFSFKVVFCCLLCSLQMAANSQPFPRLQHQYAQLLLMDSVSVLIFMSMWKRPTSQHRDKCLSQSGEVYIGLIRSTWQIKKKKAILKNMKVCCTIFKDLQWWASSTM